MRGGGGMDSGLEDRWRELVGGELELVIVGVSHIILARLGE